MLRPIAGLAVAPLIVALTLAFASGLQVNDGLLQLGSDVLICDPDGVTVSLAANGGMATQATVSGISPACQGLVMTFDTDATEGCLPCIWVSTGASVHVFNFTDVPIASINSVQINIFGAD